MGGDVRDSFGDDPPSGTRISNRSCARKSSLPLTPSPYWDLSCHLASSFAHPFWRGSIATVKSSCPTAWSTLTMRPRGRPRICGTPTATGIRGTPKSLKIPTTALNSPRIFTWNSKLLIHAKVADSSTIYQVLSLSLLVSSLYPSLVSLLSFRSDFLYSSYVRIL